MRFGNISADINDMWIVAHDSGELTSAATDYTISGLDGDTDCEYYLICRSVSGAANHDLYLRINSSSPDSDYGVQYISGVNTSATATRETSATQIRLTRSNSASGSIDLVDCNIMCKSTLPKTVTSRSVEYISGTTVTTVCSSGGVWNNSADELTSLYLFSDATNGIGIGSRIILLKKVHATDGTKTGVLTPNKVTGAWERIADYTVSGSPAASYQVTGISGDTYPIYRVIYRGIDDTTVGYHMLRLNNSSTNYGLQQLQGVDTSIYASRSTPNGIEVGYTDTDSYLTMSDTLLYIGNGYERSAIGTVSRNINGTSIEQILLMGHSYNDTSTEITTFDFVPASDNFNIGTHIEVYRLNL